MKESYDSYYDYDFSCKNDSYETTECNDRDWGKAFNGGGPGG